MAGTVYSETKVFGSVTGERLVSFDVGSGSVTVAVEHEEGSWLDFHSATTDSVEPINFGYGWNIRFTVAGDATYAI